MLKPESWEEVFAPATLRDGTRTRTASAGGSSRSRARRCAPRRAWQGFKTEIARFLGSDLTVIVLCNLAQARPARFTDALAALVDPTLGAREAR